MSRRTFLILSALIFTAAVIYKLMTVPVEKVVETSSEPVASTQSQTPPSLKVEKPQPTPEKGSGEVQPDGVKVRVRENKDAEFQEFDRLEKEWLSQAAQVIGAEHYQQYLQMRDENDKEKMQAYQQYHDYLRQKYGDKFSYHLSEDQSKKEKAINQKWLLSLQKLIGTEPFKNYLKARDQFNETQRRKNKDAIQIEF